MNRRRFILASATLPFTATLPIFAKAAERPLSRVRPGDAGWPSPARWDELRHMGADD
jgi:hypothetical protein